MIDTRAFAEAAARPFSARDNCGSAVAAALQHAPAFRQTWRAARRAMTARHARGRGVLQHATRYAAAGGLAEVDDTAPAAWGVLALPDGREALALRTSGVWLLRLQSGGVAVLRAPRVLRQWEIR